MPAYMSEWYPRMMYIDQDTWRGNAFKYHRETYGPHKEFGLQGFHSPIDGRPASTPRVAGLFDEAGAKYVVPVAEHHDGFPMYDCSYSEWTAAKMGPKRDVVGELAKSRPREGNAIRCVEPSSLQLGLLRASKPISTRSTRKASGCTVGTSTICTPKDLSTTRESLAAARSGIQGRLTGPHLRTG